MKRTARTIGIDIGGTNLRAARIASDGSIEERISERITRNPQVVTERVIELVRKLDRADVVAVGVGIPGRVDARHNVVLSGGYLDLSGDTFADAIEAATGKPVAIDNDCNMALVAEIAVGAGQNRENVVMFTIGTGIGGAVVLEGKIVRGRMSAGQLGHLTADFDGLPCVCGRRGCVETTSSGLALARWISEAGFPPETVVEELFRLEAAGHQAAAEVLLRWVQPLRAAIDTAVAAFAPDLVLLGGGLGHAAHRALANAPALAEWYLCPVERAELGDDAGVIGAGICALIDYVEVAPGQRPHGRRGGGIWPKPAWVTP
jgi:glucokinase